MRKLSRNDKMWLLFFALAIIAMVGGCMYETVTSHKTIGPRPEINIKTDN